MGSIHKKMKIHHDSDLIPMDIVNEILQKLPAKSVAKFVRVSKSWATIIHSNYFIKSFSLYQLQTQQQRHCLLFALKETKSDNWSFFSSPSSSPNLAIDDKNSPLEFKSRMIPQIAGGCSVPIHVKGLLSFIYGKNGEIQVINNPSTGKSLILPRVKSRKKYSRRYLGFDPIKSEYKVLCIIESMSCRGRGRDRRITPSHNQILTLGSKSLWRKLDLWTPHHTDFFASVCIDGIIYYLAYETLPRLEPILVRFDVSSEKFLTQVPCSFLIRSRMRYLNLINYESKLAIVHQMTQQLFDVWILEDAEELKWLKITHDVSPWRCLISGYNIETLGTIISGEIVYTCCGNRKFYVIYQDHKKNQHRIVDIITPNIDFESYDDFRGSRSKFGFIDYVESVMLL